MQLFNILWLKARVAICKRRIGELRVLRRKHHYHAGEPDLLSELRLSEQYQQLRRLQGQIEQLKRSRQTTP